MNNLNHFILDINNNKNISNKERNVLDIYNDIIYLARNSKLKNVYNEPIYEGKNNRTKCSSYTLTEEDILSFLLVALKLKPSYLFVLVCEKYNSFDLIKPILKNKKAEKIYYKYFDDLIVCPLKRQYNKAYLLTLKNNSKKTIELLKKRTTNKSYHTILGTILGYGNFVCDLSNANIKKNYGYKFIVIINNVVYNLIALFSCVKNTKSNNKIKGDDKIFVDMIKNMYSKLKYLEKYGAMFIAYRVNYTTINEVYSVLFPINK